MPFTTPDTGAYLFLGLAVSGGLMLFYIASLWARARNARRDLQTLDELRD